MRNKRQYWPVVVGGILCMISLLYAAVIQKAGYITYLNSDMASEVILANQQATSGHFLETQWIYSTEIHSLHMNLLYALAFLFTDSYFAVRVIGNLLGFVLGMASCVVLCRRLGLPWGGALCIAALLPVSCSTIYAENMTIGGYYIVHLSFAYIGAYLWLCSAQETKGSRKGAAVALVFAAFCALEGFLSVRYVLCFMCPMVVTAMIDMLLAPEHDHWLKIEHKRYVLVTIIGFAACVAGYILSEIIYPHIFFSGTGSASSFQFNALNGSEIMNSVMLVFADFLKLLGWRGEAALFSGEGLVNLCIAAVLVLGTIMTIRVYRNLKDDECSCTWKRMIQYAVYAFLVNLFCFVFIKGTYLNRYLIVAVLFFIPMLAVVVYREKGKKLKALFCLLLCMQVGVGAALFLRDTVHAEQGAQQRGQAMMDAAAFLRDEGYTHGYGSFWQVRVMQERTNGELTFTGIAPSLTEEGAVQSVSLEFIRWLEMTDVSDFDASRQKTFLILTNEEAEKLEQWLVWCGAPEIYANKTYRIFGFESSQALWMDVLEGKMTTKNVQVLDRHVYLMEQNGVLRIPPYWREAGEYEINLTVEGVPAADSVLRIYSGRNFEVLSELKLQQGENKLAFTLDFDDKYWMMQVRSGSAEAICVSNLLLDKKP